MKQLLALMRVFFTPFNGWPWLYYVGLALLPLILLIGLFHPLVAFGLAVWDYVMLLAIPFTLAPKVLRMLLCNQRLNMVPGMQRQVMLALLLFTLLQSSFIAVFATLYDANGGAPEHFRNAAQLFIANSIYIVAMQYAVTTRWAVISVSVMPVLSVGAVLYTAQGMGQLLVSDATLAALLLLTLGLWLLASLYAGSHHRFRPEHESMLSYKFADFQRPPLAQWLFSGGDALTAPDATLLLGYPADLMTRFRVMLYLVFLGPLVSTGLLVALGIGDSWAWHPTLLELFIACSLPSATFSALQSIEWVARLRLIWLRRHSLREELWRFLERQIVINLTVLLVASLLLTSIALLFSALPASLLLHYPLLVLLFNAFYSYYIVCARAGSWSPLGGLLVTITSAAWMGSAIWAAFRFDSDIVLHALEGVLAVGALNLRMVARNKLLRVDWLLVKPARSAFTAMTSA